MDLFGRQSRLQQSAVPPGRALRRRPLVAACAATLWLIASAASAEAPPTAPPPCPPPNAKPAQASANKGTQPCASPATQSANPAAAQTLGTVNVTGISSSIENALQTKENADDIVEAISPEDLGKLPDTSIAESLSRLPGLATQRIDGQANLISIRGLSPDFAGTTLDGREEASTGENRGVEYDQFPAELIDGAVVYKTPDASLVGQGLSGTVDLHTVQPLDYPQRTIALNARGQYASSGDLNPGNKVGDTGHRISASYIDQFFDHTLGVAFGFAQLDSPIQEKQYQAWWWGLNNGPGSINQAWGGPYTPGLPDSVLSEEGMQLRAKSESQLRNGLLGVLEWAPTHWYHSTLDLYYSKFNQESYTNGLQWASSPYNNAPLSYSDVATSPGPVYPLVTSGVMNNLAPILQNDYNHERDGLFSWGWNNRFELPAQWEVTTDLSYSTATVQIRDAYLFAGLPNGGLTSSAFELPNGYGYPSFTPSVNLADPNLLAFTDPDNYGYDGREEFDHQDDTIKAVRLQASHPLGWIFSGVDLGFDYSERIKTKQADVFFAFLDGNGSSAGTYKPGMSAPILSSLLLPPTSLAYGGIPGIVDYNVLNALASQFYLVPENEAGDWSRNYSITERVPLVYAKFNIDTSVGDIPLRGNAGVQVVHTDQSSDAIQTNGNTYVGTLTGGTGYTKALPSLNLVADLGNRQYLRFGLAKTMARGRIDDEKVAASAGVAQVTTGPAAGQVMWSGSGGNPYLKPYVAVGTDLSWEKYFGDASYVAAAVFNKNLLNYIYDQTVLNYNFSGFTNNTPTLTPTSNYGPFTRPENGTGGRMRGIELSSSLEGKLLTSALDGFGAQANFSFTQSFIPVSSVSSIPGAPSTLPGLSKKVANLTLYYEKNGFSVRIAERFRSAFTGEAVALFDQLGYTKVLADRQTDFQAEYDFSQGRWKGLSLLLQVNNLTNTPYHTEQIAGLSNGVSLGLPLEYDTYGRTVLFGVNYKL